MINEPRYLIAAILTGLGATLLIDLWALFLRRGFDIASLNYCLFGRWLLHMRGGILVHRSIAAAAEKRHECTLGWIAHYLVQAVASDSKWVGKVDRCAPCLYRDGLTRCYVAFGDAASWQPTTTGLWLTALRCASSPLRRTLKP